MTLAATYAPQRSHALAWWSYQTAITLAGSLLIALSAQLSFNLPFSPVPITGQTFGILLAGALLGSVRGAMAVIAYLFEGMSGLPVFAGGAMGAAWLLGPTGGYLLGFVPAAFITGFLAERGWDKHPLTAAAAMALGTVALLTLGSSWLSVFVGPANAMAMGVYPFLLGDLIKISAATVLLPTLRKFV